MRNDPSATATADLTAPAEHDFARWKSVGLATAKRFGDNRATLIAAGVTYFLLLALFPAITAFVSVYGLFADSATIAKNIGLLSSVLPAGGIAIINDQLTTLTAQPAPTLGFALVLSLALAVWSASSGVKSLFEAMNIAYEVKERRSFLGLNAVALAFTIGGVIVAALLLTVVVAIPAVFGLIGLGKGYEWLIQGAGYILLAVVLLLSIAALYRFGPSRPDARWRWISPGAVVALLTIGIVSGLFSWYASNLAHFDKTYGSLGGLIGFLFWMWVSNTAVIAGAELNAELDRQTGKSPPVAALRDDAVPARQRLVQSRGEISRDAVRQGLFEVGATLAVMVPVALLAVLLERRSQNR